MNHERIIDELAALVGEIDEGNADPLESLIQLKRIEEVLEASINQIKERAVAEAKKYGAKEFELHGVKVQVKEGAARWSYKHILQWNELEAKRKGIEDVAKNRYKNPSLIMADADGVEIPMAQCTYDKESVSITIPKL